MKRVGKPALCIALLFALALFSSGCALLFAFRDGVDYVLTAPVLAFRAWAETNGLPYPDIRVEDGYHPSGTTIFSASGNSGGSSGTQYGPALVTNPQTGRSEIQFLNCRAGRCSR